MRHKIFIIAVAAVFLSLSVIFLFFPRPVFSELERRDLAQFPEFSWEKLRSGEFTAEVSHWFSDSEPFRDKFMEAHMTYKDKLALRLGSDENQITFHTDAAEAPEGSSLPDEGNARDIQAIAGQNADGVAKVANNGIIVTGRGKDVRALMVYGGSSTGHSPFAATANKYKRTLGQGVNVYVMVIPTAIEYYCPDKVKDRTKSQLGTIRNIHSQLSPDVKAVDVYTPLGQHAAEDIYLRTDHHWSPLGGFYAAQALAKAAGVKVPHLKDFDRKVVHGFVGSMYGYSKDINVKNAPEDFVYYVPKNPPVTTTFIIYKTDDNFNVTGKTSPVQGSYFKTYKDGSGGAYCTFMGTDQATVKVQTPVKNHRRILFIKDSFGNAIPSNLFGSFEQVHVIDFRYFIGFIPQYVKDNGITDVVLSFNIFGAYGGSYSRLEKMLAGVGLTSTPGTHKESQNTSPLPEEKKQKDQTPSQENNREKSESVPSENINSEE